MILFAIFALGKCYQSCSHLAKLFSATGAQSGFSHVLNIMYYRDECFFTQYGFLSPLKSNNSGESCR